MDVSAKVILLTAIQIVIALMMICLGMETSHRALLRLWRDPRMLASSLIAAFVVVPLITYGVFQIAELPFGAKAGLFAISITPGAPMVYRAAMQRGIGNPELAASFQVTVGFLVIILAPLWLTIVSAVTGGNYGIPPIELLKQVSTVQFIPILIGMALHHWQPGFTQWVTPNLLKIVTLALGVLVVILLVALAPKIVAGFQVSTAFATIVTALSAIISGHLLCGPEPTNRLAIANANAQRNPGLALTITSWSVPEHQGTILVVVVIYVISSLILTAIYTGIYRRSLRRRQSSIHHN